MNNTKYYIQKAHKRTVLFEIDSIGKRQFFIQLPNILFKIPYRIELNSYFPSYEYKLITHEFCTYFIKKQYESSESNVCKNLCIPFEVTIPPFGNSTYYSVCLGEELEVYYEHESFDSAEELTKSVIKNYWQSVFDDAFDVFDSPSDKESFLYNWQNQTKINKPFDFNHQMKEKFKLSVFEINKEKLMK